MLKRRLLLVISLAALCLSTAPASANLFDFVYGSLRSDYTLLTPLTGAFTTSVNQTLTTGSVTRQEAPIEQAAFGGQAGSWGGLENFTLWMDIANIDNFSYTADGVGSFILTDTEGDTIAGDFTGVWSRSVFGGTPAPNVFYGTMSNVTFNDVLTQDGNIDGHSGSASMSFAEIPPWYGTLFELNFESIWFGYGNYDSDVSSVHAAVIGGSHVPVPAAVLLGIIGLGVVGLKLRKYA